MAVVIPIETKYNPRGVKTAIRNLDDFKGAVDKAGGGFKGLAQVSGKYLQAVGGNIKDVGSTMTRNMTLPIVGLGAASLVAFNEVDNGLDTVAARSGVTGKALGDLQGVFRNVAAGATQDMGTIGEVVGAVGGKFGLTGTAAERFSTQILDLSRVTGTDAVTATEAIGETLTAFGLKADNAGGFLDTLLVASQRSNVSIEELAQTAAAAAPTFQTYGLGAAESVGLVSALAGAGLPATRVVAGLNSAFKKFTEDGIKDVPGALTDVLTRIREMKDPTKATRLAVDTFGSRVGVTLAQQVRDGRLSIDDLTATLNGSEGALGRATDAVEGPQEQFARLKNQLMLTGAAFAETLLPALQAILPYVQRAVDWFKGLDENQRKIIVTVGLVVAAIGPLLMIFGSVVSAIGAIIPVVAAVISGIGTLISVIGTVITVIKVLAGFFFLLTGPIGIVIAVIVGLVAIFIVAYKRIDWFRNFVDKAFAAIKDAIATAFNWVKENWPTLLAILTGPIGIAVLAIVRNWDTIKGAAVAAFNMIKDAISTGIQAIGSFLSAVRDKIGAAIDFVKGLPGKVRDALADAGTWLVETGKNMIQGLLDGAGGLLSRIGEFFLDKLPWWIVEPFKKALGISSPSKVFEGFGKNIGDGLIRGSDGKRSTVAAAGRRLAEAMKSGTKDALQKAIDGATDVRGGLEDRLSRLRDYFERLRDIVVNAFAQLKDRAQRRIDDLRGSLESLQQDARAFSDGIRSAFAVAFAAPKDGQSALDQFRKSIQDSIAFTSQIRQLRDLGLNETSLQNIIQAGVEQGKAIADSLLAEGPGAINEVNSLVASLNASVASVAQTLTDDQFAQRIALAEEALRQAQDAYNAIAAREAAALAHLASLAEQFGLNTDAMTLSLDKAQERIEELLSDEQTATQLLTDAVSEVTTGLLQTSSRMAQQASALQRRIDDLERRISAAQARLDGKKDTDGKRAIGGPVMAGRAYTVGELGPETFVPSTSGTILTARETRGLGGVTIAPGAVQISVAGGDTAQVQAAVDAAFDRLVRELQAL